MYHLQIPCVAIHSKYVPQCDEKLFIKGDPYQTNQIFLNLAKNAFDAIKNHGNLLKISSKLVTSDWIKIDENIGKDYCHSEEKWEKVLNDNNEFALIEFEDNGKGIAERDLKNVFQAFYTTKGRDKGTGLGLSISSDIAKRHGGNIAVKSIEGEWTTFQILIPLLNEKKENQISKIEEINEFLK